MNYWWVVSNSGGRENIVSNFHGTRADAEYALLSLSERFPQLQLSVKRLPDPPLSMRESPFKPNPVETDQQEYEAWCAAGMPGLLQPKENC